VPSYKYKDDGTTLNHAHTTLSTTMQQSNSRPTFG